VRASEIDKNQRLFPHFGEAATAVFAVKLVRWAWRGRPCRPGGSPDSRAKRRSRGIVLQFLIEAMALSGVGGAIGGAVGVASALILAGAAGWPTIIEPQSVVLAFGFSLAIGVIFGLYPARRAAALEPAIALRHE
jgi:hypothetical protein